jgi:aryl-phospho-beta-D-glucosidase BglC (GH1 family)
MKNWGCNAVRINIGMWDIGYSSGNLGCYSNSAFWVRLDSQINAAIANGITPIICGWHAIPDDYSNGVDSCSVNTFMNTYHTWTDYQNVYKMLAQRYTGKDVIYEMYNEPLNCDLATYQTQMEATIDIIRTYDADAVVIVQAVGTGSWDTQNLQFVQNYPIRRSNIVYCVHIYAWQITSNTASAIRSKLSSGYYNLYAAQTLASGYPVIFTEFGCGGNGQDNNEHQMNDWSATWLNNFMAVCDSDGYSGYTAWRWSTSNYDSLYYLLADWNGNPTTYGTVIRNYYMDHMNH